MAEYIEREALYRDIENSVVFSARNAPSTEMRGASKIMDRIKCAPAADVVPARRGEWKLKHIGAGHYWECSMCHTNPCIYVTENTKFCPNCGCRMDGGNE